MHPPTNRLSPFFLGWLVSMTAAGCGAAVDDSKGDGADTGLSAGEGEGEGEGGEPRGSSAAEVSGVCPDLTTSGFVHSSRRVWSAMRPLWCRPLPVPTCLWSSSSMD